MKFTLTLSAVLTLAASASAGVFRRQGLPTSPIPAPGQVQGGNSDQCNRWDFVEAGSTCELFLTRYPGLTLAKLQEWNTAISSPSYSCFLWANSYLCTSVVGENWGVTPPTNGTEPAPPTVTPYDPGTIENAEPGTVVHQKPGWMIQAGQPVDCESWYVVKGGDQCAFVTHNLGISQSLFEEYNPALGSGCANLWDGYGYCIGTIRNPYVAIPTPTEPPRIDGTPLPTQVGMVSGCKKWEKVGENDNCGYIVERTGLVGGEEKLMELNPALKTPCTEYLWANYYVCIGV